MKVTSSDLTQQVHEELRALRKHRAGASVENLARLAPIIRGLLGAGDPHVARARMTHELLDAETGTEIDAAAAALGFLADGETVLDRLTAYGQKVYLDQRQVRRLSDRGLETLAQLITTNWPTETVPQLSAAVVYTGGGWDIQLNTRRLLVVEMQQPRITLLHGSETEESVPNWIHREDQTWEQRHLQRPISMAEIGEETSVVIIWRGELWPKFNVTWHGASPLAASETLGNKLMLRLQSED